MTSQPERPLILIWGPESTGTRLIKEILILNGYLGNEGHKETWGNKPEEYHLPPAGSLPQIPVWRFSYPMGNYSPNPKSDAIVDFILEHGYSPKVIVTFRDMLPQSISALYKRGSRRHVVPACYSSIFSTISRHKLDFWVLSYESLIQNKLPVLQAIPFIEVSKLPELKDGNAKYYPKGHKAPESLAK